MENDTRFSRMMREHPKAVTVFATICMCIIVGFALLQNPQMDALKRITFGQIAYPEDFAVAHDLASQLGYEQDNEIGVTTGCFSTISDCGIFIIYYTDLSLDEFRKKLPLDGYATSREDEVSFNGLYFDVGRDKKIFTTHDISNPRDTTRNLVSGIYLVLAKDEKKIDLRYYDIKSSKYKFILDNQAVTRNIVVFVYKTIDV